MKKNRKYSGILAIVLAFVMLFTMIPAVAFAEAAEVTETAEAFIETAVASHGTWGPEFSKEKYSYRVIVPDNTEAPVITYTVSQGATVMVGEEVQTADKEGNYTLKLERASKYVTVTSDDQQTTKTYDFAYSIKSTKYDVPDSIIDYLPINSQYTNQGNYGTTPERTLHETGDVLSLGNFGGYITYYYDKPLTDNPNNKYGVDFYVYGNSQEDTSTGTKLGFMEPGQVWVSEDGVIWYALAGSEHYEEETLWDYQVTYTKTDEGETGWNDNYGNEDNGLQIGQWPLSANYPFNSLLTSDTFTLSGILIPCVDGTINGHGTFDSYSKGAKFGYVDVLEDSMPGADANPYLENDQYQLKSSGFDLTWAVDAQGRPVDVSNKEFHYVKVVTASNIWAGTANEKSTEVNMMVRTTAQAEAVGKTEVFTGLTVTDSNDSSKVYQLTFEDGTQSYELNVGDAKYVSVKAEGAAEDDNIYINNQRITASSEAKGIKLSQEGTVIRIIVQNGDKEPVIRMVTLRNSEVENEESELINSIKINTGETVKVAETTDGRTFKTSVGHRTAACTIVTDAAEGVALQINGEDVKEAYALSEGDNTFTVTASKDSNTHSVTLVITKESTPVVAGTITVHLKVLGDTHHSEDDDKHTLAGGGLTTWLDQSFTLNSPAAVVDLLDKAFKQEKWPYVNQGGNYIVEVNGLAAHDNGNLSGWMYTFNGKHPNLGVAEQRLSDGDRIVFHYTDDYTKEESAKEFGGAAFVPMEEEKTQVESSSPGGTTTVPATVTLSGSTAVAAITKKNASETIKQAAENKSAEIAIQIAASDTKGAEKVEVNLDTATVKDVVNKTEATLTVRTENGTVTLDRETLKTVADEAEASTVTLEVIEVISPTEVYKKAAGENSHIIQLVIKSGTKTISLFNEGKATVTVEIPSKLTGKKVAAIHIGDDGKIEHLKGHEVTVGGKKHYRFDTPHFSTFALVDADEIGLEIEEQTMSAEEMKAMLSDLSPVAHSVKTAKKNVKVTLKLDAGDKAIIEALEDEGFTVKYNFYRSTKKSSKYSSRLIKDTTTYTQTGGNKGTKYYYKARVQVFDAEGNLIARTALKQCRYASRTWNK